MSAFSTDQVFKSHDDLMQWVQNIARAHGYVIVTKRSKTRPSGYVSKVILMCDRGGAYKSPKDSSRATGTRKTNCPFELVGKYFKEFDYWTLSVIRDEHNHPPAEYMDGHAFAKRLENDEFKLVADLTKKHVTPRDILGIIKEHNKNNVSTLKTIYNARNKIREMDHKGKSPMQVLMSLLHDNGYIFQYSTNSLSNELEALFFVHRASFELLRAFPHVLLMDATYKTSKYNMPFLQIVGVTSTNRTFSVAFACMHKEMEENYIWVLKSLRSILDECLQPRFIVTNRELALMNACQKVFPNATQLLCRWHISQNIFKRYRRSFKSQRAWDNFISVWNLLIGSQTWASYMEYYTQLQSLMNKYPGVLKYLDDTWLNKYKEMFVSFWIDQCLHFGNRTTNRVESQHAKLKMYLRSSKYTLDKFVSLIDEIVKSQYTSIKESFEKSRVTMMHQHNLPCLKSLHGFVSHEALDIIVEDIKLNPSNCGCQVRKCYGLPCACESSMHLNAGTCIPLDSIDVFWRKLDVSPLTHEETDDITCDAELKAFQELFDNQTKPGKKILLEKLKEIIHPTLPIVEEPVVQINTRGRPSLKRQQQKCRANPATQNVDEEQIVKKKPRGRPSLKSQQQKRPANLVTQNPRQHPSLDTSNVVEFNFMGLEPSPTKHSSNTACLDPLKTEIPDIFHRYITHIQDVIGDGHCGFRSTLVALGQKEDEWSELRYLLLDELHREQDQYKNVFGPDFDSIHQSLDFVGTGVASRKNWMIMPDTGVLIANRFGAVVVFLSKRGSSTCFPLWKRPEELPNHPTLTIAHVYGNHYIMVRLEGDYPMSTVIPLWTHYRNQYAGGWLTMYKRRLQIYNELVHRVPKNVIDV